nr:MAG TPA: hypothetical protein [Caudoviricetes sp.]
MLSIFFLTFVNTNGGTIQSESGILSFRPVCCDRRFEST